MAPNKSDNWVRTFCVNDPKKHKKGFTIYKVTSLVYPKQSPEAVTKVVVWKRYNDFKKLHSNIRELCKKLNIPDTLPKFAKAKLFKRFEEEVINERIRSSLLLLEFIGLHSPLFTSELFSKFFESSHVEVVSNEIICENNNSAEQSVNTHLIVQNIEADMLEKESPLLKLGGIWDFPKAADMISLSSHSSSDDCTTFTSDTTESCSLISSPLQQSDLHLFDPLYTEPNNQQNCNIWLLSNNNDDLNCIDATNSRMVQSLIEDKSKEKNIVTDNMARSMSFLPGNVGESVTCHSEKPVKPSEMWLSVRTQDFNTMNRSQLAPGLTDSEAWLTPPGTPAGKQDYLVEAGYHVGQAQSYEVAGEYEAAFSFYKAAIACLLSGVHDDEDRERRKAVREKTTQYLQRAEKIYSKYLANNSQLTEQNADELKLYKVLSIVDRVMLVLHSLENKCYVIKVLEKSPCPVDTKRKTIIPKNVPYMVQLVRYYETEGAVYLVLQYASGGKLWDHIDTYLQSIPPTPTKSHPNEPSPDSSDSIDLSLALQATRLENVNTKDNSDQKSYFELIKSYTSHVFKFTNGDTKQEEVRNIPESIIRSESHIIFDKESILNEIKLVKEESESQDVVAEDVTIKSIEELEVNELVASSQKLLASVNKTLMESDAITKTVTVQLSKPKQVKQDIPKDLNCPPRKRSSSSISRTTFNHRSRFDRRFSTEDVLETRTRTASSSLDRSAQWSRLAAMMETPRRRLPEATIRVWAAELLVGIETLHRWGIICKDLHPDNILLGDHGHILLTYQSYWQGVDSVLSKPASIQYYAAPEVNSIFPVSPATDWWSYGALLFELLTGRSLAESHPFGILGHTVLNIPDFVSIEATSLLTELLKYNSNERLGSGSNGSDDIKAHPFFELIDWQSIYDNGVVI